MLGQQQYYAQGLSNCAKKRILNSHSEFLLTKDSCKEEEPLCSRTACDMHIAQGCFPFNESIIYWK